MIPNAGGIAGAAGGAWWVEAWSSQIAAALAVVLALCGLITLISFSISCMVAGILQIFAAVVVLALEAPTFVSFLSFAAPVNAIFTGRPNWLKAAVYVGLSIVPWFPGCIGIFFILGFLASLGISAVFGLLVLGRKASGDDMRFQAAGSPGTQPYSPTSP